MDDFKLPNYWYIVVTDENLAMIDEWKKTTEYPNSAKGWYCIDERGGQHKADDPEAWGRGWISTEQFKKYVLKQDDVNEIIGYKLKDDCRKYAIEASMIAFDDSMRTNGFEKLIKDEYHFVATSRCVDRLIAAQVFTLWFEPVYAPKYKLPKINGYEGESKLFNGKYGVKYGCKHVSLAFVIECLNLGVYSIKINNESELISEKDLKQIVEYFDNL